MNRTAVRRQRDLVVTDFFKAQQNRPADLADIDLAQLPSHLRALLVTDSQVTRFLGAVRLTPILADVQASDVVMTERNAAWLDSYVGPIVRRRVALRSALSGQVHCWAQALLAQNRLSESVLSAIDEHPSGLGAALNELRPENRRELLWFGQATQPCWPTEEHDGLPLLSRAYRIWLDDKPIAFVEESFITPPR
ncbi:MAG: DUF98 domain-containing protein [Corynebacteriales bacterium]|nr:DUF98 domain-containing protein [Mycobacteriales bacterium]